MSQTSAAEQYPKELKIGYWNVGTVNGRISKIVDVMVRLKCDIAVCVDARRPGDGDGFPETVLKAGKGWSNWEHKLNGATKVFDMYWVGNDNSSDARSHGGFCIIFKPGLKQFVRECMIENSGSNTGNPSDTNASTSRNNHAEVEQITQGVDHLKVSPNNQPEVKVLPISINTSAGVLKLICCYWPVNAENEVTKIENELKKIDDKVSLVAILGEINATFGKEDIKKHAEDVGWQHIIEGINSLDLKTKIDERGKNFMALCGEQELVIASLLFRSEVRTWENHFAIGRRRRGESIPLSRNQQIVRPKNEVCYNDEVTEARTTDKHYNNLCIASLNFNNASST